MPLGDTRRFGFFDFLWAGTGHRPATHKWWISIRWTNWFWISWTWLQF